MRRVRYSVAVTLDGFIADPDGGYDWIIMDEAIDFAAMFAEFDTFVMGRKRWDVSAPTEFGDMFGGKEVIVLSNMKLDKCETLPTSGIVMLSYTIPHK
jgi:dihydrofolate reductase